MHLFRSCVILLLLSVTHCKGQNRDAENKSKFPSEADFFRKTVPDSLKHLLPVLDSVFDDDQRYRDIQNNDLFIRHKQEVRTLDSINLVRVMPIVDRYGILSPREIGFKGNTAIYMTLQHSSTAVHSIYLTVIESAFKKKKITPSQYAMFVDRTLIGQNRMQLYGTQVALLENGKAELKPVVDADSLNVWRASIGMQENIEEYLKRFGVKWNLVQYKKDLPSLSKKYKLE